jgi:hypothetical protein
MKEWPLISIVWRMLGHVGRLVSGSLPGSVHDMKAAWIWASLLEQQGFDCVLYQASKVKALPGGRRPTSWTRPGWRR